jgi:hypothetical protein
MISVPSLFSVCHRKYLFSLKFSPLFKKKIFEENFRISKEKRNQKERKEEEKIFFFPTNLALWALWAELV